MNVNPDPRPGRWLLPLVVLGMVTFTYVFVNQLPGEGASTDTTVEAAPGSSTSSTSLPDGSEPGDTDTTAPQSTGSTVAASPEVTAYIQAMSTLSTELTELQAALSTANSAWEDGGDYSTAQAAFTQVRDDVAAWQERVAAVSVPEGMADTQDQLLQAANQAANQAAAALDGLVNSSGPEERRQAVTRFDEAVSAFAQLVTQAGG